MIRFLFSDYLAIRLKNFAFCLLIKKIFRTRYSLGIIILSLFMGTNAYAIESNNSAINEHEIRNAEISSPNLLPPLEITGVVKDSSGNPLPSVTVELRNKTSIGTTTDQNGRYVLVIPSADVEGAVLKFSTIGFQDQEIPVSGRSKIDVTMIQISTMLEETVITAFGKKRKKEDVVGAISTISPEELKIPSSNLTTALGGKAAGVIAYQRTGEPGMDNAEFFIRGVTTFGYKVDPLILIDNVEATTTELARLQVDDIESFSILKDATATAVYGARGANGVILITTKEGRREKLEVSLRVENSFSKPTQEVKVVDPVTYMKLANEALLGREPLALTPFSPRQIEHTQPGKSTIEYPAVNWQDALLKKFTTNQRANLSVRGGGSVAQYYVSGSFNQDNGILKVPKKSNFNNNINLKTYSLRANVQMSLTKTTQLGVRLSGVFDDYNGPIDGGTQVYNDIMRTPPTRFLPFYPTGERYKYLHHIMFGNFDQGNYLNPYADMVKGYKQYSQSRMQAQLEVNQDLNFITKGMSFTLRATTSRYSYFSIIRQYNPFYYELAGKDAKGEYTYSLINEDPKPDVNLPAGTEYLGYTTGTKDLSSVFFMQGILDYQRKVGKSSFSSMLVGMMRSELNGALGSLQESLPHRNLNLAGRFTYGYLGKYNLEFNFGYNGSERFSTQHRFGFFPSIGAAWSVSKEDFWNGLKPFFSNLRLRASYGLVGNDAIGAPNQRFYYLSEVNMNSTTKGFDFGPDREESLSGVDVSRYANSGITWETAYKTDIGVEMGFFNNRLEIEGDYFKETRKNIFMQRADIPQSMGLAAGVYANIGEASGEGVDFSVNYTQSFYKGLWLKGMANFTYATSKYNVYEEPDYEYPWLYHTGYPINIGRGYIAERLFIDDKEVQNSAEQQLGDDVRGGDIKYVDVNGDGKITSLDMVPIGYPTVPEINFGFGLSMGYKGFDLSVFFEGLARESFFISPTATAPFRSYLYPSEVTSGRLTGKIIQNEVLQVYADNHWSEENKDLYALYPRLSWASGNGNNEVRSTWWMRNGEFIRLKQIEVGYSFKEKGMLKRLGVTKLRLYASGLNLFTISKFKLWDVEMGSNGLGYPIQKVFNTGIKLNF